MSLEKMKKRWGINGNVPDDYEEMVEKGRNAYARESQINELKNDADIKNSMNNISQKVNKVFHSGNRIEKESIWDKIQNTVKDLGNTVKNIGLGAKSGISQVGNYIENANENNFSNYKNIRNQQFYSSKNVDEITKGNAKIQNNMLINKAKENMSNEDKNVLNSIQNNKIEKNLIKDNIQKSIQEDSTKIQENIDNTDNKVLKKINELAPSIGQMGVGAVASAINPALGVGYFTSSAGGSYIDDAKQRGMKDKDAFTYGTIMGAVEGATEEIGIGNFQKAGKGIKALVKGEKLATKTAVNEISKQTLKEALKDYGVGIADNTIQEAIIEPIQEIVAGAVGGKEKANWNGMGQRMIESGINGGLVGAIVGGSNLGVSSCVGVVEKINNGQTPTKTEMQQAVKDASKQLDTSKIVLDSVKQTIDKQNNINQQQNQNVVETNVTRENKQENQAQNNQTQDNYKNQAIKEIENSHLKSNQKENLIKEIDGIDINEEGLSQIRQIISDESKLDSEATYKTDNNRKRTYMKYKNNTSDYDTQALDLALDSVKENRNGKRTVKQWLEVADKLGQQLADKSNDEIEQIAYRSWNDLQPNTKDAITRYDNRDKVNMPFQKFTSDDWVNTIYNAVNEARNKNSSQQSNISIQNNTSENIKQKQLDIINKSNPMTDDYHTGIRTIDDIKTFEEAMNDDESFVYGDFSMEDAQKALNEGKVTVYSSKPIEQGGFVTTSQNMAKDYAGNGKIYSQEVNLNDVAWINGDEGQFAKVDNLANNQEQNNVAQNINEFNGYTQKEINNLKSNKISIAQNDEDISNFVSNSRKVPGNFKMYLGKLKENTSNLIKNRLGINVDNFNISLKTDDVRKIFKDHGSEKTEIPRGQVPITESDFLKIPDIINNPDVVSLEGSSPQGKPAIRFEKNIDGNNVVVTYVSDKHNNLEMQTMYKFKNNKKRDSSTALHENQTPGLNTSKMDSGTNLFITNSIPPTQQNVNSDTISNNMQNNENNTQLPTKQKPNLPSKGEEVNYTEMERPEGKIRKHYRSIIESSNTTPEAKAIAKELMGTDTYVPESNTKQLNEADRRISQNGADNELKALTILSDRLDSKITANDIAVGERLIEYYSKIGDKAKLQEAIQSTAMAGTQAGQTVQALSLLNHQTPQGQVTWIQRSVDKMNRELVNKRGEKAQQFNFTPDMQQKIMETTNQQEMNKVLNEVYEELGQQVSKTRIGQLDSWRYFSMLANPKTHIRNIVGNLAMGKTQSIKNKLAGVIEGTVAQFNPNMERTHTLKPASKEVKQFAKNDIVNVEDRLELNDNKYNPKSRLEGSMRTFKSDAMEKTLGKLFDLNGKALEVEDAWGLKSGYVKAMSEYMTANNLNPDTITDQQLAKARNYAIEEAKEATFHSQNAIATAINQFSRKNKLTKGVTDAVLPFVKTPMNVAKAGMEYNPAGLIKTLTADTVKLRKGNITINKYIDNLSKGLTGTGIAVLGYAMAEAGILKASGGDDDKKEKYDEALGRQAYAIQIGDKTYSLDWLAPAGIPLFVGAEAHNINKAGKNEKTSISNDDNKKSKQIMDSLENWANAMTNSMSPMAEMSMISGLTSALKSYDQDSTKMLGQIGTNALKSYVNQYVPTALGQVAKAIDNYERSTTSTKNGVLSKAIDQTKLQVMSKIPGLRQQLPVKTDVWGKEQKQEGNILTKAVKNGVVPFTIKNISNSAVDKELNNLYAKTGESSILPTTSLDRTFTIDSQNYRMTNEEYNKYRNNYGKISYKILEKLVKSSEYKNLTNEQKQKAIENVYSYAKESNKIDYANNNKLEIKPSTLYNTMKELENVSGGQASYLDYSAKTQEMSKEREKSNYLVNSSYSNETKKIIYGNTIGKDDKLYNTVIKNTNININQYLEYKSVELEADKDKNGKSISGSKKSKVYNYINSNISGYENRLILLGSQYKLSYKEQKDLSSYIDKNYNTIDEKIEIYKYLSKNFEIKNGKVYYK